MGDSHMTTRLKASEPGPVTLTKRCPDCGRRFRRYGPRMGPLAPDGRWRGCAYCRRCANRRALKWQHEVVSKGRCAYCGHAFPITNRDMADRRHGVRPVRFCGPECRSLAARKWTDLREMNREKKRRERANRRARGVSSNGLPYKSEAYRLAASARIVPPTERKAGWMGDSK